MVTAAYQFHDQMLGTLLEKAGDDTTVILMSDHGFHPDHLRPASIPDIPAGPAIEHRDFGILVIRGPGIKKDRTAARRLVTRRRAHDPDALRPARRRRHGRQGAFAGLRRSAAGRNHSELGRVAGRGRVASAAHAARSGRGARGARSRWSRWAISNGRMRTREMAVKMTVRELRYNLGEAYQDDDRHLEAHEIFARPLSRASG